MKYKSAKRTFCLEELFPLFEGSNPLRDKGNTNLPVSE